MILVTMGSVSADILYTPGEDKKKSLKNATTCFQLKELSYIEIAVKWRLYARCHMYPHQNNGYFKTYLFFEKHI